MKSVKSNFSKFTYKKFSCTLNHKILNNFDRESAIKKIKEFNPLIPVEEASTPPKSWYLEEDIFQLEKEKVFKDNYIAVATTKDFLDNKNNYISGMVLDQPYVIIADESGGYKAFHNVCSHRGAQILREGTGKCNQLVCPYHGWTYKLNGDLMKSKNLSALKNFDPLQNGLKPLQMQIVDKLIFINFNSNKKLELDNLDAQFEPLREKFKEYGYEKSFSKDMKFLESKTYLMSCNWKTYIDNYVDGSYHVPIAHKNYSSGLDHNSLKIETFGKSSVQTVFSKNSDSSRFGKATIGIFMYPNLTFNLYGNFIDTNIVIPISKDQCLVNFEWYGNDKVIHDKKLVESTIADSKSVQDEDMFLNDIATIGMKSNAFNTGRYVPKYEKILHDFHKLLYDDLVK